MPHTNSPSSSHRFGACLTFCIGIFLSNSSIAYDAKALERCTKISDDTARLSCYDGIMVKQASIKSESVAAQPPAEKTIVTPAPVEAIEVTSQENTVKAPVYEAKPLVTENKETLPQDLGGSKFAPKGQDESEEEAGYRGKITSCRKGSDGKHFFIFDNGQIWKQVKSSKKRYRDCDFEVTVSKDIFGYKMQIDGRRGTVRINRKK